MPSGWMNSGPAGSGRTILTRVAARLAPLSPGRWAHVIKRRLARSGQPPSRASFGLATTMLCAAVFASPHANAQCTSGYPYSGGVIVDGGTQALGSMTAGYDNALVARNGAVVTTSGAVSGGGGICAETTADVTANGSVTGAYLPALNAMSGASIVANGPITAASGGGMLASGGSTITLNGVTVQGAGGQAMMADGSTIIANGVTITWPNGYGGSLAEATNGGVIRFTPDSTITVPSGGFSEALLLADGPGSSITAHGRRSRSRITASSRSGRRMAPMSSSSTARLRR